MCVLAISVYMQHAAANSGNCQSAAVTGSEKECRKHKVIPCLPGYLGMQFCGQTQHWPELCAVIPHVGSGTVVLLWF